MPEEMESSVERLEDELHEVAEHAKENWIKWAALLSALFAVIAAISGLMAARDANDAMIEQIQASDQWAYYQAKGIKSMIAESEQNMLSQLGKPIDIKLNEKISKYKEEQKYSESEATRIEKESRAHLARHEVLASAVTLFQVAIAVIAITVLTRRRRFLLVSLGLGLIGTYFFISGLLM